MPATDRANQFLNEEEAFRLGCLLTEASHAKTRTLSQTMKEDLTAGIEMLQAVDLDILTGVEALFSQPGFDRLVRAMAEALSGDGRIFFTGCGATGRLSILLEAAWRRFWRGRAHESFNFQDRCMSVMAGGDYALIRSVEGFEDFPEFGRYHLRQAGVKARDVVVAITEGGETPFVIGTAWEGLAAGAEVFFVYNNPTDLLKEHVERSRAILEDQRIHRLELATGPMAIMGSTRMQATTVELLVVGAALEQALCQLFRQLGLREASAPSHCSVEDYRVRFAALVTALGQRDIITTIGRWVEYEEALYRRSGLMTYAADDCLLDVLTDTTERSPTFMLPAFRREEDLRSPPPWAFVKNPGFDSVRTWHRLLKRHPRGLEWRRETYQALQAPATLRENPPGLANPQIYQFKIGNEWDPSRIRAETSTCMMIGHAEELNRLVTSCNQVFGGQFSRMALVSVGILSERVAVTDLEAFQLPLEVPDSPLRLWRHLTLKLILNTVSTATMCRLGRVWGNAMVWVSPSNKKLIDRGCRLIAQHADCSYERACRQLFAAMEDVEAMRASGQEVASPVALAIEAIRASGQHSVTP